MRQVTPPGRWVWVLAGLLTAAALLIPGTRLIDSVWTSWPTQPAPAVTSVTVHATPTAAP
jgi:hypothetical protein